MSATLPKRLEVVEASGRYSLRDPQGYEWAEMFERQSADEAARRWNAHEALVAALRDTLARFVGDDRETWGEAEIAVEARARAALRDAGVTP